MNQLATNVYADMPFDEGISVLRSLGIHGAILVQNDGGSNFTSAVLQQSCSKHGCGPDVKSAKTAGWRTGLVGAVLSKTRTGPVGWNFAPLRCAVLSKTESLKNSTVPIKYSFAFRQDWRSFSKVQKALPEFLL